MPKQSKALTEFYTCYYLWLCMGAPEDEPFSTHYGLCGGISNYPFMNMDNADDVQIEMEEQLGRSDFPFGGSIRFIRDQNAGVMHKNKMRINWVKQHLDAA